MMPVVGRADAVEWEAMFNVSAGTVLIRRSDATSSALPIDRLTGAMQLVVAMKTLATNALFVSTLEILMVLPVSQSPDQPPAGAMVAEPGPATRVQSAKRMVRVFS